MAVIEGTNVFKLKGYGVADRQNGTPITPQTAFEIGSITKVFTSLLLADMANRNEVSLDDAAAKYLPGFNL